MSPREMSRHSAIVAGAVFCLAITSLAWAQYPHKPIRMVIPNPPGGAVDTLARMVAPPLSARLGQPIVVENRVGSNGNIAMEAVARAAPDGYTWLLAADAQIVINPHLYGARLPIDPLTDLVPAASVGSSYMVLTVHPSLPVQTFEAFIEYARRADPPLAYASIGNGSQHHLVMEMLKARAGLNLLHVPYKGGGPATTAVLAGEVAVMLGGNSTAALIRSGRLRGLALAVKQRTAKQPDLPTIEQFYPGVNASVWFGIFLPAAVPAAVVARVRSEVSQLLVDADMQERFAKTGGMEPYLSTPEEFTTLIRTDYARYRELIKALGTTID